MTRRPVAVLGAGRMGATHARNAAVHPDLALRYIVDTNQTLARALAGETDASVVSLESALDDDELEGLIIASSTDMHLEHSLLGARRGLAMFCEKPIDLNLAKAKEAQAAFGDDVRYVLGFNRRFDPDFAALRSKLTSGAIGPLESIAIINHDPAAPPADFIPRSGGLFKDFTIHDLDLVTWLVGAPPISVFAWASCLVDPTIAAAGDVDTAKIVVTFASGVIATISNTRRSGCGYDQRVEAYGAHAMACANNLRADTVALWSEDGASAAPLLPNFVSRYARSYRAELHHFADVLIGRAQSAVGYAEGLAALALAEACAASARTNSVVSL